MFSDLGSGSAIFNSSYVMWPVPVDSIERTRSCKNRYRWDSQIFLFQQRACCGLSFGFTIPKHLQPVKVIGMAADLRLFQDFERIHP